MLPDSDKIFTDSHIVKRKAICVVCKGSKMLCGKSRCPILVKYRVFAKTKPLYESLDLDGSSPPSVFIGRMGYPKVFVGPLLPPIHGNTAILDLPERWLLEKKTIEDIVNFRYSLVRGMFRVRHVMDVTTSGKIVDLSRDLALSRDPTDVEVVFHKKPKRRLILDSEVQPFGPSARLKKLGLGTLKLDQRLDKASSDTDLKAQEATISLYQNKIPVTKIQRAFSMGAFGLEKNRKFVPTRWSITACDDIIGKALREQVKRFSLINEFRVYENWQLDNRFIVLMIPRAWKYELIEAWYPNTVWNPNPRAKIAMLSDNEEYQGRTKYAAIGGCYYAARLAVSEHLVKERRQAAILILREAHPGYILPVGVWNVRENVRMALRGKVWEFNTLKEALSYIQNRLAIPLSCWIRNSAVIKSMFFQKTLDDYF